MAATTQQLKAAVDAVRKYVDEGAQLAEEVVPIIPSIGGTLKVAIEGIDKLVDVADDLVDQIIPK